MDIEHFKKLLKGNNAIRINDEMIIFNNFELYSFDTGKSKYYRSVDDLVADNKEIKETILNTDEFKVVFDGGRGSGSNQKMGGAFHTPMTEVKAYWVKGYSMRNLILGHQKVIVLIAFLADSKRNMAVQIESMV